MPDLDRELADLARMFARFDNDAIVAAFSIDMPPVPKGRPRLGNGRVYTPKRTAEAEVRVAWHFRAAAKGHKPDAATRFGVRCVFHTSSAADIDNLLKLVLDGLNGIAWADDRQVDAAWCERRPASPRDAHTDVLIWRLP